MIYLVKYYTLSNCEANAESLMILMLKRYERYINKVSMVTKKDRFGNLIRYVDEDFKAEIQMRYLEELLKCKVIKNDNNTK